MVFAYDRYIIVGRSYHSCLSIDPSTCIQLKQSQDKSIAGRVSGTQNPGSFGPAEPLEEQSSWLGGARVGYLPATNHQQMKGAIKYRIRPWSIVMDIKVNKA